MEEDLKLDGKAPKTIELYLSGVRGLANHCGCSPSRLTEEQVRQYLLYLVDKRNLKPNSMRPILAGIQFFYRVTVPRNWKTLAATRIPKTRTLPAVLTPERVWQLIEATKALHCQVLFRTAYTCGLRPGDARHLTPQDIDADRMLLHIRTTKGQNNRCVPLPLATLDALRQYWKTHRNPKWLFPGRADLKAIAAADKPISERSVQRIFAKVVQTLGFTKKGLCPHTLRHSYATALLEAGVNLKVLQSYLGHKSLQATEVYLHLTRHSDAQGRAAVECLMNGPASEDSTRLPTQGGHVEVE